MARPRTPIGAYGKIAAKRTGRGWEASARYRTARGTYPRVKRTGSTKTAAINNLKSALTVMTKEATAGRISRDTRFKVVAETWLAEMQIECDLGTKSPNTVASYRTALHHILPSLGERTMHEIDTPACNRFLMGKRAAGMGHGSASNVRSVLSSICGYAVREDALGTNPVREIARIKRSDAEVLEVRALTAAERADLFAKLDADTESVRQDIPDLLRGMLAVGCRISELLGSIGSDFGRETSDQRATLTLDHRILRLPGQGLVRRRRSSASTKGGGQVVIVAAWAETMFTKRKLQAGSDGPLFPNPHSGGWRDPRELGRMREALDRAGYPWVTSHVMRKTVATAGNLAGLSMEVIADQLNHQNTAVTKRHYVERQTSNTAMAEVIDGFFPVADQA